MFVDPLAEQFAGWTPYNYVHQNPINLSDPTGMNAESGEGGGYERSHTKSYTLSNGINNIKKYLTHGDFKETIFHYFYCFFIWIM